MALLAEPRLVETGKVLSTAPRILLAHAQAQLAQFIAHNLTLEGMQVELATSRCALENALLLTRFDAIVIDESVLGPRDLCELAPALGKRAKAVAIIWLGEGAVEPGVHVLAKPVLLRDLLTEVRRAAPACFRDAQPKFLRVGDIVIEPQALRVRCAGRAIELTMTEFRLLALLASDPGRVFSRQEICREIWGPAAAIEFATINQYVVRIRRALAGSGARIRTVRNAGYAVGS